MLRSLDLDFEDAIKLRGLLELAMQVIPDIELKAFDTEAKPLHEEAVKADMIKFCRFVMARIARIWEMKDPTDEVLRYYEQGLTVEDWYDDNFRRKGREL